MLRRLGGEEGLRLLGVAVAPPDEDACRRLAEPERLGELPDLLAGARTHRPGALVHRRSQGRQRVGRTTLVRLRGYPQTGVSDSNYVSGDDYVVEFLGYRFSFNGVDFEQRVNAAAVRLGLVEPGELEEDETGDLVELTAHGRIDEPRSGLGDYLVRHWERLALVERRVARLLAPQAHLPRRLARPAREGEPPRGRLGRGARRTSATASPTAAEPCSSSRPCPPGTSSSSGAERGRAGVRRPFGSRGRSSL